MEEARIRIAEGALSFFSFRSSHSKHSISRYYLGVIKEQWREGGYVIDFKVGQSFGEPQGFFV